MSHAANEQLVRRYFEDVWEQRDPSVIDDIFSPDFVNHTAAGNPPPGPAGLRQNYEATTAAFPDVRFIVDESFSNQDADRVVIRYTMVGTHQGEFQGTPSTGKHVSVKGIGIYRIENETIAEGWVLRDSLSLMRQLEAL